MQDPSDKEEWRLLVGEEQANGRLDSTLAAAFPAFSRSRLKELILGGAVAINGQTAREPSRRLKAGEELLLEAPEPTLPDPEPEPIPLDILYEDADLIVVDKPAGLVVHPAPGNRHGTLVNALLHHCGTSLKGIGGVRRPGIVHRLDKDTSGILVAAKSEAALAGLAAQFADHGRTGPLRRNYAAFVWGEVAAGRGTVEAPLGRDPASRIRQAVRPDGRAAITHYAVEARFGGDGWRISRLDLTLETGRTHQIRVHMAHLGHPVVADPLYAARLATKSNRLPAELADVVDGVGRQALHARALGFRHPISGEILRFESPLPDDLAALETALAPYDLATA